MTKSGTGLTSVRGYYRDTAVIANMLGEMFAASFPEEYRDYTRAFEAGVFLNEDPGPWLGRAIVYKLDGSLHTDKNDFGPAACVPCGNYKGGHMLAPQLGGNFT
jgi:hypothetical protein